MKNINIIFIILFSIINTASLAQTTNNVANQNINTNNNEEKNITITNPASAGSGVLVGSPTSFNNSYLYNSPWNFTPPELLFHPSKTINDHSAFHNCRLVNLSTVNKDSLKDKILGIIDEKEFISTGIGKVRGRAPEIFGQIIVCGLNTNISPSCVQYIGTGYVLLEDYSSTEAALVGISKIAAKKGSNLVANLNCPYLEAVEHDTQGLGATIGGSGDNILGSLGGSLAHAKAKRTVQPHCNGDFFVVVANCRVSDDPYMPNPRPYRRYLPSAPTGTASPSQQAMPQQMAPVPFAPPSQTLH